MPGIKSVVWNDTNKARALDALLALNSLKVSKDISEQIAIYIGNGCTGKAVDTLFTQIGKRKKPEVLKAVTEAGFQPVGDGDSTTGGIRGSPVGKTSLKRSFSKATKPTTPITSKVQKIKEEPHEQLVADLQAYANPHSPPTSGEENQGGKPKQSLIRNSPRAKKQRVDYKLLGIGGDDEDTPDNATGEDAGSEDNFDIDEHMARGGDGPDDALEV